MRINNLWRNLLGNIYMVGVRIILRCLEMLRYEDWWRIALALGQVQRPLFDPSCVNIPDSATRVLITSQPPTDLLKLFE